MSPLDEIRRNGVVFTKNVSPSASFGGISSNFVFGVFSGIETELSVRSLIYSLLCKIQTVKFQAATNELK